MAMQTATAVFTGVEDEVEVTWPAMTGEFGILHGLSTDGGGGPLVSLIDRTPTGCTVAVSAPFVGQVDLVIFDKP